MTSPHAPRPRVFRRFFALLAVVVSCLGLGAVAQTPALGATATSAQMTAAVVARINSERVGNRIHALVLNASLNAAAHRHNLVMASRNVLAHQCSGEAAFGARITASGYRWSALGENVAWSSTITVLGASMMDFQMYHEIAPSNGHRVNLLNPTYKNFGVDVYVDAVHHKIWLTEDFGAPL